MPELTRERLGALRVQAKELLAADRREVLVCAGTGCIAGGSLKIYDYLKSECEKRGLKTRVALRHEGGDDAIHFKRAAATASAKWGRCFRSSRRAFFTRTSSSRTAMRSLKGPSSAVRSVERLLYELNGKCGMPSTTRSPSTPSSSASCWRTAARPTPRTLTNTLPTAATAAFEKALFEHDRPRTSAMRSSIPVCAAAAARASRPGRKWDSVRRQPEGQEVRGLQRRRGRPRRVHGPLHHGGQSPLGH